jgi:competence protein ComEC
MATSLARVWVWVGGLCAGVAYGFDRSQTLVAGVCAGMGAAVLALRRRPRLTAIGLGCLAFALGALDTHARIERGSLLAALARGAPRCSFEATALESEGGLGTLVSLDVLTCSGTLDDPGLAWLEADAAPGARVAGEGWLVPLGDDGFGHARRRFGAGAEIATTGVDVAPPASGLHRLAHRVRAGLGDATASMAPKRAGLLTGLTTGETSMLSETVTDEFRSAGLSHLVAVSGQNVAMVLGALALATRHLSVRARTVLALAAVGMFVLVVGPQPSVLRAGAMAMIVVTALGAGGRVEPWHVLGVALAAVIALRPAVLYSAGLHLSAAATAGLLLWARPLVRRLSRLPTWIALGLAATLSAQVAVTPLIAGLFGNVSMTAPVANVLALPAVPPATVLGLCAAIVGAVAPDAGRVLALGAEPFVAWILGVAHAFGGPEWAAVEVPTWTGWPLGAAVAAAAVATAVSGRRGQDDVGGSNASSRPGR